MKQAIERISCFQKNLDLLILLTPTGQYRDELCNMNIKVLTQLQNMWVVENAYLKYMYDCKKMDGTGLPFIAWMEYEKEDKTPTYFLYKTFTL